MDIVGWTPEHPQNAEVGFISDFYDSIMQSFFTLARSPSNGRIDECDVTTFLRKQLERLYLWGSGHSVQDGYLDRLLSQSQELKQIVLARFYETGTLLHERLIPRIMLETEIQAFSRTHEELGRHLNTALYLLEDTHEDINIDSKDGNGNDLLDDIPELFEELKTIIDCLMDLSIIIDDLPIEADAKVGAIGLDDTFEVSSPDALVYCRKIRDQFPSLPHKLVQRLGEANAIRSKFISKRNIQLEKGGDADTLSYAPTGSEVPSEDLMSSSRPTAGSSSIKSSLVESTFERKLRTISEDTRSVISFASLNTTVHGTNSGKRRVPPLPSLPSIGGPFECPFCFDKLNITDRSKWK